ncbi:MAG: AzlC family ABC transporter permease [Clostridia bacterium]|nr:AzlC family ABC transporter permease [Clostridia bacterium]
MSIDKQSPGVYAGFDHGAAFRQGLRDGIPIGLGYFAVAFSLGIAARGAGLSAAQGFVASLLTSASAGEYAVFTSIAAQATVWEIAVITLIANARYLLMSCALSQRFAPEMPFHHRLLIGTAVTDEIFGITIARPGLIDPYYTYGAIVVSVLPWAAGTSLGIVMGNMLPVRAVSALSVALYGMFLAIIIPPARQNRVVAGLVVAGFALSLAASLLPALRDLSAGTRTILLTVALSGAAAALFPVRDDHQEA